MVAYIQDFAANDLKNSDGDSFRDRAIRGGSAQLLPVIPIPVGGEAFVSCFWYLRSFCGNEEPITPSLINEYTSLTGRSIPYGKKSIIVEMDRAFRVQYSKTLKRFEDLKRAQSSG